LWLKSSSQNTRKAAKVHMHSHSNSQSTPLLSKIEGLILLFIWLEIVSKHKAVPNMMIFKQTGLNRTRNVSKVGNMNKKVIFQQVEVSEMMKDERKGPHSFSLNTGLTVQRSPWQP
jgi:hypothetical protein